MATSILDAARLREILEYDTESGLFTWRIGISNRVKPGMQAGNKTHGYIEIGIENQAYRAHKLAWLYVFGYWPEKSIDHIDGNRSNNAIKNLRLATNQENSQNKWGASSSNKSSGMLGVTWHKQRGKWMAQITHDGRNHNLGLFDTAELAHSAYLHAKQRIHEFGEVAKSVSGDAPERRSTTDKSVSGFRGVSLDKRRGTWGARISIDGAYKHIGSFNTAEEANEACIAARKARDNQP